MPRPNKNWERKYRNKQQATYRQTTLLNGSDNVYSASVKLACGVQEAQAIILQMMRLQDPCITIMRLLDMDDMGLHGQKIIDAYHGWAGNDYLKLAKGLESRTIKGV